MKGKTKMKEITLGEKSICYRTIVLSIMLIILLTGCSILVPEPSIELAEKYMDKDKIEKAIEVYDILIEDDEENYEAWIGLAKAYMEKDEFEDAGDTFKDFAEIIIDQFDMDDDDLLDVIDEYNEIVEDLAEEDVIISLLINEYSMESESSQEIIDTDASLPVIKLVDPDKAPKYEVMLWPSNGYEASKEELVLAVSAFENRLNELKVTKQSVVANYEQGYITVRFDLPEGDNDSDAFVDKLCTLPKLIFLDQEGVILLDGSDVKDAHVDGDSSGFNYKVVLNLNDEGADKFGVATATNIGKRISIIYNDEVIMSPIVQEPIYGGEIVISGIGEAEEANLLADQINLSLLSFDFEAGIVHLTVSDTQ